MNLHIYSKISTALPLTFGNGSIISWFYWACDSWSMLGSSKLIRVSKRGPWGQSVLVNMLLNLTGREQLKGWSWIYHNLNSPLPIRFNSMSTRTIYSRSLPLWVKVLNALLGHLAAEDAPLGRIAIFRMIRWLPRVIGMAIDASTVYLTDLYLNTDRP